MEVSKEQIDNTLEIIKNGREYAKEMALSRDIAETERLYWIGTFEHAKSVDGILRGLFNREDEK